MTSRIMLIPCSHVNKQGETALRACHEFMSKNPRTTMIVSPPTIGVSPLMLESFGIDPDNYIAVNGCELKCVDKLLVLQCGTTPKRSLVLFEKPDLDPRSALTVSDQDVITAREKLEKVLYPNI